MSAAAGEEGAADVPPSVALAAEWLASGGVDRSASVIPQLRSRFDLTAKQAVDAIRAAASLRGAGQ